MIEPGVTCGGPGGGARLLAYWLHAAALLWSAELAARIDDGRPGAAVAATAPSASAAAASTGSSTRSQGRDRAFTGTPQAGGSVPRHSLPP